MTMNANQQHSLYCTALYYSVDQVWFVFVGAPMKLFQDVNSLPMVIDSSAWIFVFLLDWRLQMAAVTMGLPSAQIQSLLLALTHLRLIQKRLSEMMLLCVFREAIVPRIPWRTHPRWSTTIQLLRLMSLPVLHPEQHPNHRWSPP
jgi:hypothetical protein